MAVDLAQALYILTDSNQLVTATQNNTTALSTPLNITGIHGSETLVSIDVRPQNERLYGLGVNAMANTASLYHISPQTGVATVIGITGSIAYTTDGTTAVDLPDPTLVSYDIDFNPNVDRLRVVAGTLNFRVEPNTGLPVDGAPGTSGTNPDGAINGLTSTVSATAYTNNQPNNGAITTQYTLDSATGNLFIQNPPNNGTQTSGITLTSFGSPFAFTRVNGFDIASGVNAATNNVAVTTGVGYAILTSGGISKLYEIALATGTLTEVGPLSAKSFAIQLRNSPVIALNATSTSLVRFSALNPGSSTTVDLMLASVASGESIVAIDFRPATGQLYGLGIDSGTNTGTLYLIDPQSGALNSVGAFSAVAFVDATGNPVDFPDPSTASWEIDFNPTVDRIRVVTSTGLNFRVNPITGAPVDGGAASGINPDGNINGATSSVDGTAYTNSFAGTTVTTQYTLDAVTNSLYIQSPPNDGTQTLVQAVTLSGSTLDFASPVGFDILPQVTAPASNAPVTSGDGFFSANVSGSTGLYRINLLSGQATLLGTTFIQLRSFSIAFAPSAPAVTSPTLTILSPTSATLGGTVADDNGSAITQRGVVYSMTSRNAVPAIGGLDVTNESVSGTKGVFTAAIAGLTTGVEYTFRAYATNALGTTYSAAVQFTPPVLIDPVFPTASVSELYTVQLQVATGAKLTVTGLPPGLKFNATTNTITGRTSAPGVYQVVITAKGPGSLVSTLIKSIVVQGLPKSAIGTFIGLIETDSVLNNNASGRVDLTVTATGAATVKVTQLTKTITGKGFITPVLASPPQFNVTLSDGTQVSLTLNADDSLSGSITRAPDVATVTGWRKTFDKAINTASSEVGYYTASLTLASDIGVVAVPQGHGFASITVGIDGSTKLAGRAADGSALACSGFLGPDGEVLVFVPLYKKLGSIAGEIAITTNPAQPFVENELSGGLQWIKPATTGRTYPAAFGLVNVTVSGNYMARSSRGSIVLGLPSYNEPSTLDFSEANIGTAALNPDLVNLVNFSATTRKATFPAPGSAQNQARTTITINAATGAVSGSFLLIDGSTRRPVTYQGMIVVTPTGAITAAGYFLLPQLPLTSSSPILSGKMELVP